PWETCAVGRVVIPNGNAVQLSIGWLDLDGEAVTPTDVKYQVFDYLTGDSVCDLTNVIGEASTMEIVVPGANMPGSTETERRLVIQVLGTFADGQHTLSRTVYVKRLYTMA